MPNTNFENIRHGITELINDMNKLIRQFNITEEHRSTLRTYRDLLHEMNRKVLEVELIQSGSDYVSAAESLKVATVAINGAIEDINGAANSIAKVAESIGKVNKVIGMKDDTLLNILLGLPAPAPALAAKK